MRRTIASTLTGLLGLGTVAFAQDDVGGNGAADAIATTTEHPLTPLSGQTIRPYTDLLLHDMGPDLADSVPVHDATGREWRTPPLWGVGLFETVAGHTRYLHDGRARDLEEADRERVLTFLRSL